MIKKLLFFIGFFSSLGVQAQEKMPETFTLVINQDNAFGFAPAAFGSFGLTEKTAFTFYSIFWTNPSFGNTFQGTDFWLETGFGVNLSFAEDKLLVNPSLGLTHGKLLSGGTEGVFADGLVPSLNLFYHDGAFETEFFVAYYRALREEGPVTQDFLLYWLYPGIVISDNISLGLHYEQFVLTRITDGESQSQYQWVGGYLKFSINQQYSLRMSGGTNFNEGTGFSKNFYKVSLVLALH